MSKYTEMSNQELMEELDWCGWDTYYDDYRRYVVEEIERRLNLPTIEIVHCGECTRAKSWNCPFYRAGYTYKADDYCSDGERIEE